VEVPVKERLTGALILIALLVIVVPEMLSGPDHVTPATQSAEAGPPVRTYRLQLDTAAARTQDQSTLSPKPAAEAPVRQPPQIESPAAESVPVASAPVATEKSPAAESKPAANEQKPTAEQKSTPAPATKPPAASVKESSVAKPEAAAGQWWAQLGSFASRDNAERLTKELRDAGYSVNLARVQAGGKDLYRVRAGPAPSREAVAALQARLAAAGHKSSLVAP
jgi:DedD protein